MLDRLAQSIGADGNSKKGKGALNQIEAILASDQDGRAKLVEGMLPEPFEDLNFSALGKGVVLDPLGIYPIGFNRKAFLSVMDPAGEERIYRITRWGNIRNFGDDGSVQALTPKDVAILETAAMVTKTLTQNDPRGQIFLSKRAMALRLRLPRGAHPLKVPSDS